MTKPVTSVAAMMLYEEGAFELTDPVQELIPSFGDVRVYAGGSDVRPLTRARHGAGTDLAPADPHGGPDLRLPPGAPRRRQVPGRRVRVGHAARTGPGAVLRCVGGTAAAVPARRASGTTRWRPTCSAGWSRWPRASSLDEFFADRIFGPLGMTDTSFWVGEADRDRLAALYTPSAAPGGSAARLDAMGQVARARAAPAQRRRGADLDRGRLSPVHADAAGPAGEPRRRAGRRPPAGPARPSPT